VLFNSLEFAVFIALFACVYYFLKHKQQNAFLLVASYIFYGWWDWRFLFLIAASTIVDYFCALYIEKQNKLRIKRWILCVSLFVNLGALCFFKYFDFFDESLVKLLHVFGMQADYVTLNIILPVGISFYTFQTLSYTIDVYRGQLKPTRNFMNFAVYVSFFPQLVAGPIERAAHLLPQVEKRRTISGRELQNGLWLIIVGFFKKLVIADQCAAVVNYGFSGGDGVFEYAHPMVYLYLFAFQIYADFSGYSDIARGLSKMMGFDLMVNFKKPYLVKTIPSLWNHWHISLSSWLRDYLYIPMGGSRKGPIRRNMNLMNTMLLGGLWHGAGFAYILWGGYHGMLLVLSRMSEQLNKVVDTSRGGMSWVKIGLIFHLVCLGWLFFRVGAMPKDVKQFDYVVHYLSKMLYFNSEAVLPWVFSVAFMAICTLGLQHFWKQNEKFAMWPIWQKVVFPILFIAAILALGNYEGGEFIYFQF